jgi:hypothetical protein
MSAYPPPNENLPIFDSNNFHRNTEDPETIARLSQYFLQYPQSQGSETINGSLIATGQITANTNIIMKAGSGGFIRFPDNTEQTTAGGGASNLSAVLTGGNTATNSIALNNTPTGSNVISLLPNFGASDPRITLTDGTTTNIIDKNGYTTRNSNSNTDHFLNFSDSSSTGTGEIRKTALIKCNPNENSITATKFVGNLEGIVTYANGTSISSGINYLTYANGGFLGPIDLTDDALNSLTSVTTSVGFTLRLPSVVTTAPIKYTNTPIYIQNASAVSFTLSAREGQGNFAGLYGTGTTTTTITPSTTLGVYWDTALGTPAWNIFYTQNVSTATITNTTDAVTYYPLFASGSGANQILRNGSGANKVSYVPSTNTFSNFQANGFTTQISVGTASATTNTFYPTFSTSNGTAVVASFLTAKTTLSFETGTNTLSSTNFSGALSGNATTATTATNATNVAVGIDNTSTLVYPTFVTGDTAGNKGLLIDPSTTSLTYNTTNGNLSANTFTGIASNVKIIANTAGTNQEFPVTFVGSLPSGQLYTDGITNFTYNPSSFTLSATNINATSFTGALTGSVVFPTGSITGSFTLTTPLKTYYFINSGSAITITIPNPAITANGTTITFRRSNAGAGIITFLPLGGTSVMVPYNNSGTATTSFTLSASQYTTTIVCQNTSWFQLQTM